MPDTPCVSVVIPQLNEAAHIGSCLDALEAQQGLPSALEVWVVDGGSTDGTRDILASRTQSASWLNILTTPNASRPWP